MRERLLRGCCAATVAWLFSPATLLALPSSSIPWSPGLAKYNTADLPDAEPSPVTLPGGGVGGAAGGLAASGALLSDTTGLVGTSYYIS